MALSLKDKNKIPTFSVVAGNLALYYAVVQANGILSLNWSAAISDAPKAIPAGLGLILVGIVNAQLPSDTKSQIVFFRSKNSLPGCQAFTKYARKDHRVDIASLEQAYGPLPTAPRKQNALWYRLYKSVELDPSVMQVHREFLFARDYTCLALMMLVVLGIAAFIQAPSLIAATLYTVVLLLQFLLAGQAARNHGRRFVTTVLALKGAGR